MSAKKRVLPADVYDALEFSALVYGGIGSEVAFDYSDGGAPLCAMGHAVDLDRDGHEIWPAIRALLKHPITANDMVVSAINHRRGKRSTARVPFADWCAKLRIVRGDNV